MAEWECFKSQNQWKNYLKNLLKTNDKALLKAIVLIHNNQTPEEKNKGKSIEDNCIGFSKIDAKEMGDIANKIRAGKALTKGELAKSRNKMQKYWKQLMIISKERAEAKKRAEEELAIQKEDIEKLEMLRQNTETLRKCLEEGISCEYGICDECRVVTGFQLRAKC